MTYVIRPAERKRPTWRQRVNPVWWLSDENKSEGWSWIAWAIRNPCCNLLATVVGVNHLERVTICSKEPHTFPAAGWNFGATFCLRASWIPFVLPLAAYRGKYVEMSIGWKMSGDFSPFTLRAANAKNSSECTPW